MTGSARRASAAASAVTGDVPDAVGTSSDSSGAALSPKRMHRPRPGPHEARHPRIAMLPGSPQTRPLPYMARPRSHRLVGARVSRERVRVAPSSIHGMAFRLRTAAAGVRISRVSPRTACVGVRAHRERLRIARTGSAQRAHAFASHSRVFAPDPPDSASAPPSSASSSSPSAPAAQELAHSSPLSPSDRSAVGLGPVGSPFSLPEPVLRPAAVRPTKREDRMNAKSRRRIEMGTRALDFSRAHPDASPGYTAAVTRLEERLARAEQLATQQREGTLQVRAAVRNAR